MNISQKKYVYSMLGPRNYVTTELLTIPLDGDVLQYGRGDDCLLYPFQEDP